MGMNSATHVAGRNIVKGNLTWELLEAPHRNGNVTRTMGEEPGYLAKAIFCGQKVVTLHVPADLALAWYMANAVPQGWSAEVCPDTLRPGAWR